MIAQLLAWIEDLGPKSQALVDYLLCHKEEMGAILDLLAEMFGRKTASGEITDERFIKACKSAGCSTGDAQELLAAVSRF